MGEVVSKEPKTSKGQTGHKGAEKKTKERGGEMTRGTVYTVSRVIPLLNIKGNLQSQGKEERGGKKDS